MSWASTCLSMPCAAVPLVTSYTAAGEFVGFRGQARRLTIASYTHMMFRPTVAAFFAVGMLVMPSIAHAQTIVIPPQPGVLAGQLEVTGPSWSFSNDLPDLSGPWASVT